ncbi:hypothetical protein DYB36_005925 [Aphanomyces astaci]|uniref:J domain-containing protein n=1 Tax=Aphanomyces astaci TaxID=112090 RepID=A0A396ZTQ9_APHAT|nr:hypothetical protein DYB36_005925 [Aphanomyces astaci]
MGWRAHLAVVVAWCCGLLLAEASPILLSVDINVQGQHIPLDFHQGQEPIDVIERFRADHALPMDFQQRALEAVCKSIPCTRASPIIFATSIHGEDNEFVGEFQLMQGDEPADAVASFCRQHNIPRPFQLNMLQSICNQPNIACARSDALLYRQVITDETGSVLGTLEIFDSQEPVDAIFAFLQPMLATSTSVEHMLRQLLEVVCQPTVATCSRTIPLLFRHPIVGPDGTDYGTLEIYYGQEPADAIFSFAYKYDQGIQSAASTAIVFSSPIQLETGSADDEHPILTLYAGDELADVLFHFGRQHNLTFPMRSQLFGMLCNRPPITCTRGHAVVYARTFAIETRAEPLGPLELHEGDEAADRVFEFADRFNLSSAVRDQILNTVCVDIKAAINVTCSRFAPVVFQVPITKNASEPPVGMLQILQVNHFKEVNKDTTGPCLIGPCIRYGSSRNWTFLQRQEWLAELCRIQRAGAPLLNCSRAEARLFYLPVMETADKEIGTLEVLEGQEPIDQVYAFLEKHDLFQTAPVNESLANITCRHVPCSRLRPRRILFSMQATYMGLKHTIQLVQPEEDWVCMESYGSKQCQHYVQVRSIEYCAKHMRGWTECGDVMGNALRQSLTYYEEELWKKSNGKDLYAKLGLVKGATSDEIEAAYHTLVLRFNNETEPQKYEKLRAAYDTLHDPEKKYYYDLPCMKFFGLCGKRQPDGGMTISTDN